VVRAVGRDPDTAADQIFSGLTPEQLDQWSDSDPEKWARESFELAKSTAYNQVLNANPVATFQFKDSHGKPDTRCGVSKVFQLDDDYDRKGAGAVAEQLAKAGVRQVLKEGDGRVTRNGQ
jgi:hypothetical protein